MKKLLRAMLLPLLAVLSVGFLLLAAACGSAKAKVTLDYNGAVLDGKTERVFEVENNADLNAIVMDADITLSREGYTFEGWDIPVFENGKLPSEVTVRAQWQAVIYNIIYDYNGGAAATDSADPSTYTIEDAVTFATPVREGYTFLGYTAGEGAETVTSLPKGSKGDVTLTAQWEKIAVTLKIYRIGTAEPVETKVFAFGEEVVPSADLGEESTLAVSAYMNGDYSLFEPFTVEESKAVSVYLDVYTKGMTFTKKAAADIPEGTYHSTVEFSQEFYAAKMLTSNLPQVDGAAVAEVYFPNYYTQDGVTLPVELTEQGQTGEKALTAETVFLPANLKVIGRDTFNNNKKLANVVFDTKLNKFKEIGVNAFMSTLVLEQITLPSTTEYLANGVFQKSALTSFRFPKALKEIGYQSFYECAALATVDFEEGCVLETVGYSAFRDTVALASVSFPSTLKVLGTAYSGPDAEVNGKVITVINNHTNGVFYSKAVNDTALSVNFNGAKLETAGDFMFYNRKGLQSLAVEIAENGVLGGSFFTYAGNNQTEITLTIGQNAYVWRSFLVMCEAKSISVSGLTEVPELAAYSTKYTINDTTLKTIKSIKTYPVFYGCDNLETVTFDSSLKTIGAFGFSHCTAQPKFDAATAANINVGDKAFYGSKMTAFDFQNTPFEAKKEVPANCFENSANLETLTNYDKIETFGAAAFKDTAVAAFRIARNMTIAGNTFAGAPTKITVASGGARYYAMIGADGAEVSDEASAEYLVGKTGDEYTYIAYDYKLNAETPVTERTIPATVKAIGGYYAGNGVLTKITLPAAFTQIPAGEFEGCSALGTVVLSADTTAIGDNAFKGCSVLQNVNFAALAKLESIGAYAFANTNLASFTAPAALKTLGNRAFNGTNSLMSVDLSAATLLEEIGEYAFTTAATANLTTVLLPQNGALVTIGQHAFRYAKIETLQIPATVKTLGAYSFGNCTALETITIGSETANSLLGSDGGAMDKNAFSTCSALQSVTIYGNEKFVSESGILYNKVAGENGTFSYTLAIVPAKLSGDITLKAGLTAVTAVFKSTNITSVIIPDSVASIAASAFSGCTQLATVVIEGELPANTPNSIFTGCTALSSVTYLGTTKLTNMKTILSNSKSTAITLTVKDPSQYSALGLTYVTVVQYEEPAQTPDE